MKKVLYIVSTPRHLYQAIALAYNDNEGDAHLYSYGLEGGTRLLEVCNNTKSGPFKSVMYFDKINSNGLSSRNFFKSIKQNIFNDLAYKEFDQVYFGNDFKPLTQWILYCAKEVNPECKVTYVDEGTITYFQRINRISNFIEWFEGKIKSISYGHWYSRPKVMGTSRYVDSGLFSFPDQLGDRYSNIKVDGFSDVLFRHSDVISFIKLVLNNDYLNNTLKKIDVLFILPSLSIVNTVYGSIQELESLLLLFKNKNLGVAVKYHPRDRQGNMVLDFGQRFTIIPSYLPAEMVFSLIHKDAIIVGDVSSALFSAKWLLPKAKVLTIAPPNSKISTTYLSLFRSLGITVCSNSHEILDNI